MRGFIPSVFIGAVMTLAASAQAAQCVSAKIQDQNDVFIETPQPLVALMLGGRPVLGDKSLPPYSHIKTYGAAECPDVLIKKVQALFEASCSAQDLRNKAAKDNKVGIEQINKGCADMIKSLSAPKLP